MSVNNTAAYVKGYWDWSILDGCFGDTKVSPTDIDGFIERNGRFLLLESKRAGVVIPTAQKIMFDALTNIQPKNTFTVIVIEGYQNKVSRLSIWPGSMKRADNLTLRAIVQRWWDFANR